MLVRVSGDDGQALSALARHPRYRRGWDGCCNSVSCKLSELLQLTPPDSVLGTAMHGENPGAALLVLAASAERESQRKLAMLSAVEQNHPPAWYMNARDYN